MLKLQQFINEHEDWEQRLRSFPYNLKIKRKDGYIIFNYQMVDSKWNDITRECRGLILHEETMTPVCVPFFKFFNKAEGHASKIDWDTAEVQEKLDGSLIKVWFHNGWHVSTNGMIDAFEPTLMNSTYDSFGMLFKKAIEDETGENIAKLLLLLDEKYTYMFELATPYNRIVIPYEGFNVWLLGIRNNKTLIESKLSKMWSLHIGVPKKYKLSVLEEVVNLPYDKEGYVVVDDDFNRVKIKSPAYVAIHHLKGNNGVSDRNILKLIHNGEDEEFLSYFPEFKVDFDRLKGLYTKYVAHVKRDINRINLLGWFDQRNKKWFIMDVKSDTSILNLPIIIKLWDNWEFDWELHYLRKKPARTLLEILNKYEKRLENEKV